MKHAPICHNPQSRLAIILLGMIWPLVCYGLSFAAPPQMLSDPGRIRYPSLSFEPPYVERILLDNGIRLYVFPDNELPMVQIKVVVGTGSMYDPPGLEGLADLTVTTMRIGGNADMSGDEVDDALESMAAKIHVTSNRDSAIFSFSVLKKDLDRGLDLFFRTLTQPSFEENKLMLAKDLKIEELRRIMDDPQKLAFREFGRLMHAGSPRGRLSTSDSIRKIRRDNLLRFYKDFFYTENMMISVTGDIGSKEAEILVKRYFGKWRPQGNKPELPSLPHPHGGKIYFLTKDVSQAIVVFGWLAPAKREISFYPFEILDFIAGSGGFRSRIFQEIRTNMGLAYSTGSFYRANSDYGLFGAYAMTKTESAAKVLDRIREILRDMAEKPVSLAELEGAKKAILNSFIFSFTSAEQISLQRLMIEYEGIPDDYFATYRSRIGNVTAEDIREKAAQYLSKDKAIVLVIGNESVYQDISAYFDHVTRIDATF